jgi:hypothetical protein
MHTRLAPLFGTAFFFFIACSIITTAQEKRLDSTPWSNRWIDAVLRGRR